MKALENTIKEIKSLHTDEILRVYNIILNIKTTRDKTVNAARKHIGRQRVIEALKNCGGDLSKEIIESREDRA